MQSSISLRKHAALLGLLHGLALSKQALHKRLLRSVDFLQACVTHLLSQPVAKDLKALRGGAFARILLHDSSCVALKPTLARAFPGPANQREKPQASLRIQVLYDLLTERFLHFHLTPFVRNDQAAAEDILPFLKRDDLLVRDLGYFALAALAKIARCEAFFLTRWRFGVRLLDPVNGQPLHLPTLLRPGCSVDRPVLLPNGLVVRLLALPLDKPTTDSRRRQARANRDRRLHHSAEYYHLLGWTLLLTNAPCARLPLSCAWSTYRLRWRIEIIFKSWKSHLGLLNASRCGRAHLLPLVLALLLFCICLHALLPPSAEGCGSLSLLKIADLFSTYLLPLCLASLSPIEFLQRLKIQILRHAPYEKRSRPHYQQLKHSVLS